MKNKHFVLISALVVILVLAGFLGYQALKPDQAMAAAKSLVGAWIVTVTPEGGTPFTDGVIFSSDGTVTCMEQDGYLGIGVWEKISDNKFAFSFWESYLQDGALIKSKVSSTVELSRDNEQFSGPFHFQIYSDGNLVVEGNGTGSGVRQHLELMPVQSK